MNVTAKGRIGQRARRLMVDTVIQVVLSEGVGYPREMDYGIALLQQRLPIERLR